jgi:glutathione S-transferase
MMILRYSPPSPFVRKVRIAMSLLGLERDIELRETDLNSESDPIRTQNPLGKIPALVLDSGRVLYDSRVILEYFDHISGGGRIIPREALARFDALRLQALCDGALDASVLIVYETRYRAAEMRVESWIERQRGKVARTLAALENAPPALDTIPHVGAIALACLLGYGDLRFEGKWRKQYPGLVAWHDRFAAQVPAFAASKT